MNRIFTLIFILFYAFNLAYAEDNQANFIVIEGNTRITNEEIIEFSRFEVGKIYNNESISEIVKNLLMNLRLIFGYQVVHY